MKLKSDHRSNFSNLSNWKEEAWKNQGFNRIRARDLRDTQVRCSTNWAMIAVTHWEQGQFTAIITLHFYLQLQYKYELFHIKLHSSVIDWMIIINYKPKHSKQGIKATSGRMLLNFTRMPNAWNYSLSSQGNQVMIELVPIFEFSFPEA